MRFHGAQQDCYLAGGSQAGTSFCAANIMQVGYYNRPYKALMRFDLAQAIPQNSAAFKATFLAWQPPSTPKAPGDSRLRTVTSEWTNQATWDVRKTGIRWSTTGGGGDVSSDPNLTGPPTTIRESNYWYYWDVPLATVNGWIKGTLPNYGLQLSTDPVAPSTVAYGFTSTEGDQALWPALDVEWTPDGPPTLDLTGSFIDRRANPFAWNAAGDITARSLGQGALLRDVTLAVDGTVVDTAGSESCINGCREIEADLNFEMETLSAGNHTVRVTSTDVQNRTKVTELTFVRNAEPSYPQTTAGWSQSVGESLGTAGAKPTAPMPTMPSAVTQTGGCADTPTSTSCMQAAANWAANVQTWLASASNPGAAPTLPTFPMTTSSDVDKQAVSAAVAGMVRLAAAVAKSPGQPQAVSLGFKEAVTPAAVTNELGGSTVGRVALRGAPLQGGWAYHAETASDMSVADGINDYLAGATEEATGTLADLQAMAADDPNNNSIQIAIDELTAYRQKITARGPVVGTATAVLSAASASTALQRAANSSVTMTAVAPEPVDPINGSGFGSLDNGAPMVAQEPVATQMAAAAEPAEPTCTQRGEADNWKGSIDAPNPAYWAPSRHWSKSFVVPNQDGVKGHRLFFTWQTDKSLYWLCSTKRLKRRGVEIEVRVPWRDGNQPPKFSEAWANNNDANKRYFSNYPGVHYRDDIAAGRGEAIISKQDNPDFAIVATRQRDLRYRKIYVTRFRTNKGTSNTAPVQYTAQATRYARDGRGFGEFTDEQKYCDTLRGGAYRSCQFGAGTWVCYRNGEIVAENAPLTFRRWDWADIIGTTDQKLTVENTRAAGHMPTQVVKGKTKITGDVSYPCAPEREPGS